MKTKRHTKILELIREHDVETQEELCVLLNREGFQVTQATVSRDIRELALTKIPVANGRQKYILLKEDRVHLTDKYIRLFRDGAITIATAENILVIHTVSGMAMAVAAAIDAMSFEEIVGTIAGDDTIMCAIKSSPDAERLKERLQRLQKEG